jgi:hypothetical protein
MRRTTRDDDNRKEKAHQRDTDKRKKLERRHVRNSKRYHDED